MKTNDLKKGARIRLRNGWYGTIMDNKKGNIRLAEVEGYETEIGSVYAHDIAWAHVKTNTLSGHPTGAIVSTTWVPVEHTPEQAKLRKIVEGVFA